MEEPFDLPVSYKGEELSFRTKLLVLGYTHKFSVQVEDSEIVFEPDEERNYRAITAPSLSESGRKIDIDLLKAIAEEIEAIVGKRPCYYLID